jgi:hypothetical protein
MVLPPHRGNPAKISDVSPYPCTSLELCRRFATSPERKNILQKFINFRHELRVHGLLNGYQWIDGSFVEDVETRENRSPNDLDVLTIYWGYYVAFQRNLREVFPAFADRDQAKANFQLDHFPVDAGYSPELTVEQIRYWLQLFTHNRDSVWKGMVKIDLNTPEEDTDARAFLLTDLTT